MKCIRIIIIVSLFAAFYSCRKYPEDNFLSLHTVKKRLTGVWKFKNIIYKGTSIFYTINDSIKPCLIEDVLVSFSFDHKYGHDESHNGVFIFIDQSKQFKEGNFDFILSGGRIYFNYSWYFNLIGSLDYLFISGTQHSFKILKLYRNEFRIKNDMYELHFTKIE